LDVEWPPFLLWVLTHWFKTTAAKPPKKNNGLKKLDERLRDRKQWPQARPSFFERSEKKTQGRADLRAAT